VKFSYEDLLSGDAIFVKDIGHFCSPKLKELNPSGKIGAWYNFYLNILSWDTKDFFKYVTLTNPRCADKLIKHEKLNVFDAMILTDFRNLLKEILGVFITEKIEWNEKDREYLTIGDNGKKVGIINRENFKEVEDMILQTNYIGVGDTKEKEVKFLSDKAREAWEKTQFALKNQKQNPSEDKSLKIANIISKLCVVSNTYNLLNVYDLTIFQLYDQFFQCEYIRAMNLSERVYSNHGGENFNMRDWLKPIIKI
jgi:flagellin-specific chaperone FliS